jgi:hypothetical protein
MQKALARTLNNILHQKGKTHAEVFKNRVLKEVFGPKREEVTGDWRKLSRQFFQSLQGLQTLCILQTHSLPPSYSKK